MESALPHRSEQLLGSANKERHTGSRGGRGMVYPGLTQRPELEGQVPDHEAVLR